MDLLYDLGQPRFAGICRGLRGHRGRALAWRSWPFPLWDPLRSRPGCKIGHSDLHGSRPELFKGSLKQDFVPGALTGISLLTQDGVYDPHSHWIVATG